MYAFSAWRGHLFSRPDSCSLASTARSANSLAAARGDEAGGYDHQWAVNLVRRAWVQLCGAMVTEGKRELLEALEPFVVGGSVAPPSQDEAAERLRMPISTLRRLRQRYRDCIQAEVASTVTDTSEIEEEMGGGC